MPLVVIQNDGHFQSELSKVTATDLLVIDFTATWCGPCQMMAPIFKTLADQYPAVIMMKVDVDSCKSTAQSYGVRSMPTFLFYQGGSKIHTISGADGPGLQRSLAQYAVQPDLGTKDPSVAGYSNLVQHILMSQTEALNTDDDFGDLINKGSLLKSDCDEQLIFNVGFKVPIKLHSILLKGPVDTGPKFVKIFINHTQTPDFDGAIIKPGLFEVTLTPEELMAPDVPINLPIVKFQSVNSVQVFIKDNQGGGDVTEVTKLVFIGSPKADVNMDNFKRVSGKAGER